MSSSGEREQIEVQGGKGWGYAYSASEAFGWVAHVVYPALVCDCCLLAHAGKSMFCMEKRKAVRETRTRRSDSSVEAEEKCADCCEQRYAEGIP